VIPKAGERLRWGVMKGRLLIYVKPMDGITKVKTDKKQQCEMRQSTEDLLRKARSLSGQRLQVVKVMETKKRLFA